MGESAITVLLVAIPTGSVVPALTVGIGVVWTVRDGAGSLVCFTTGVSSDDVNDQPRPRHPTGAPYRWNDSHP